MSYVIRKAEISDCENLLGLIKELAIYEKEPDAVKTTVQDLKRDGFGSEAPRFQSLVVEDEGGGLVGFALYFFTWSTWEGRSTLYLEDLFVDPAQRGRGMGGALFKRLARIAMDQSCLRFEWSVLDWNNLARDFYHRLGAKHKEGWLPYRLEGQPLVDLAIDC